MKTPDWHAILSQGICLKFPSLWSPFRPIVPQADKRDPPWILNKIGFVDWYCFYYFTRDSLVAWLEALFVRFFLIWILGVLSFFRFFFVFSFISFKFSRACVCMCWSSQLWPWQTYRRPQSGFCVWFSPFLVFANCTCVLVRVCLRKCVNICKYKQARNDVICNIKVKMEINVHSDIRQKVNWQVFRHVTKYYSENTES